MNANRFLPALLVIGCAFAAPVTAGTQDDAKVALHMHVTCDKCDPMYCGARSPNAQSIPCRDYTTTYIQPGGTGAGAYVILAQADSAAGVGALQFGIAFTPSFAIFGWTLCADDEFSHTNLAGDPWGSSGSGNRVVWDPETNCQRTVIAGDGVHAIAGVFYLVAYGAGELAAVPDTAGGASAFRIVDCSGATSEVTTPGGIIGYLTSDGFNPCTDDVPARPTTWGRLKRHWVADPAGSE